MWSRDWPRPKMKEIWLLHLNVLEINRFICQNFNLTCIHVVLNGNSEHVLFNLVIISYFCLVPVPLQMIYVVIETKEMNLSNLNYFSKLKGYSHSN